MGNAVIGDDDEEVRDARAASRDLGFDVDQFVFEKRLSSQLSPGVQPVYEVIIASRRNIQKLYDGGYGTSWPVEFENDLKAGEFGKP